MMLGTSNRFLVLHEKGKVFGDNPYWQISKASRSNKGVNLENPSLVHSQLRRAAFSSIAFPLVVWDPPLN